MIIVYLYDISHTFTGGGSWVVVSTAAFTLECGVRFPVSAV